MFYVSVQDTNRSIPGDEVRVAFNDPITWANKSQARSKGKQKKRADDTCLNKVRSLVSKRDQTEIEDIIAKVSSFSLDETNEQQQAHTSGKAIQNDNLCSDPTCSNPEREFALDKLLQSLVPAPGATQKEILAYAQQRPFLTPIGKVVNRISPLRTNVIAYVESFKYLFSFFPF